MIALLLALAPAFLHAPPPRLEPARGEVVVEHHEDGDVRLRYEVDDEGRRHGLLEQFFPDGTLALRAHYQADALDGKYEAFREDGSAKVVASYRRGKKHGTWRELDERGEPTVVASYRSDLLHGRYEAFDAGGVRTLLATYKAGVLHGDSTLYLPERDRTWSGKYEDGELDGAVTVKDGKATVSRQKWKAGALVQLDGLEPFPRPLEELRASLEQILRRPEDAPAVAGGTPDDPLAAERLAALRRLQAYRHLCRLEHAEMELVPEWNALCDAASEACRMNGGLSHTPEQPAGMDDERYRDARRGASNSNLSTTRMVRSVDSYMDDSDPSNIDRIGHRRWCLNPALKRTGFGGTGEGYSAIWAMDGSGGAARGLDAVLYPPAGWVPVDFFGARHAWSLSVLRGGVPAPDGLFATVRELDEHWVPTGEPLELDHQGIAGGGYGSGPCLVFRPVGLEVAPGKRYLAEVSVDGGRTVEYRYVVAFCDAVGGD